jgi:hypothetical protein
MQHPDLATKPAFSEKLDELVSLARDMENRIQEFFSIPDLEVRDFSSHSSSRSRSLETH